VSAIRIVWVVASAALALSATSMASTQAHLSEKDASELVVVALSHGHIARAKHLLSAVAVPEDTTDNFYAFQVISEYADPMTSPVVGNFAVDRVTGDVWSLAGNCTKLQSAWVRKWQEKLLHTNGLDDRRAESRSKLRPVCDADMK
jgi:hypothetical protein